MKTGEMISGCACHSVSRRQFLTTGCAACIAAANFLAKPAPLAGADENRKVRIHIVYTNSKKFSRAC